MAAVNFDLIAVLSWLILALLLLQFGIWGVTAAAPTDVKEAGTCTLVQIPNRRTRRAQRCQVGLKSFKRNLIGSTVYIIEIRI